MEKFNITENTRGIKVAEINKTTVAIVEGAECIQLNQLKWDAKNDFDYLTVYMTKKEIIQLAEQLKEGI